MTLLYLLLWASLALNNFALDCMVPDPASSNILTKLTTLPLTELEQQAQTGNIYAQYALAVYLERRESANSQTKDAYKWYCKAAEKLTEAQYMLGRLYERKQEWQEAFNWYSKAANHTVNNSAAQYKLVQFYEKGLGIEPSVTMAFYWCTVINRPYTTAYISFDEEYNKLLRYAKINALCKAAYFCENNMVEHKQDDALSYYLKVVEIDENHVQSLYSLARTYEQRGEIEKAKSFYLRAAHLKHSDALYKIAFFAYEEGDYTTACSFVIKACQLNHKEAHYLAGLMNELDKGFEQNNILAYQAYSKAAAQGHEQALKHLQSKAETDPDACYILGNLYKNGINGNKDPQQALLYFKRASSQKHAKAYYALACYYSKEGDMIEAAINFGQAAHLDYNKADYKLGKYYEKGALRKIKEARDILQCYLEALRWYKSAYEKGYSKAEKKITHTKDILEELKLLKEPDFMNRLYQPFQIYLNQLGCPLEFFYWVGSLADLLKLRFSKKVQMTVYYLLPGLLKLSLDHNKTRILLKELKKLLESPLFSNGEYTSKAEIEHVTLLINFFKSKLNFL